MSNLVRLKPIHLNIRKLWREELRGLAGVGGIDQALNKIQKRWLETAEFKYQEHAAHDEWRAREEFELDVHIGQVKIYDWTWLVWNFEADILAPAQLAFLETIRPMKNWEVVENEFHAVIADGERSWVSDLKYGDRLSASAALLWAGDLNFKPTVAVKKELRQFEEELERLEETRMLLLQSHLRECGEGETSPLH